VGRRGGCKVSEVQNEGEIQRSHPTRKGIEIEGKSYDLEGERQSRTAQKKSARASKRARWQA
jgi:hypothetical protein